MADNLPEAAPDMVTVTGDFYDVSGRPLEGTIVIRPVAEFIAETQQAVYSGPVESPLVDGKLKISLLPTGEGVNRFEPWRYEFNFEDLRTKENRPANLKKKIFEIPQSATVPQLLEIVYNDGSTEPVIRFSVNGDGDLVVEGAFVDPTDEGAIVIPVEAV